MQRMLRIGTQIWPDDPFWVQVREAIVLHAEQLGLKLVSVESEDQDRLTPEAQLGVVEELLALELDALIGWGLDDTMITHVLDSDLPVIHLGESAIRHPRFVSPLGLAAIAARLGRLIAERIAGKGLVLIVGGRQGYGEDGRSRIAGLLDALRPYPQIETLVIPCPWRYEQAYPLIVAALAALPAAPAAVFGLSDSLALAARDALRAQGLATDSLVIVGVNGDPLALAAIADGSMTATMQTPAVQFGTQALDLALRAARRQRLPAHFGYNPQLVTADNVITVAAQHLFTTAAITNRLVGFHRQQEQQRLNQLETSIEISRRAGQVLDRQRLIYLIANLIRDTYGYDEVQLLRWDAAQQTLWREHTDAQLPTSAPMRLERSPVLAAALNQNQPVFIPDMRYSHRFAPDPAYPDIRARVVVPIRLGGEIVSLLDLQSYRTTQHTRHELVGLQTLADQLGTAMRNAELYEQALRVQRRAEQADQLKTRLLANVSHELRTPLNLILGHSQAATELLNTPGTDTHALLQRDLQRITQSGDHLIRLINDLLDLSRATIGELDLFPETITTRTFLEELFQTVTHGFASSNAVGWRLVLPPRLPVINADPVRLRQILLNLLDNARKFTLSGQITLGAEVQVPYLHIWVADTGKGIAPEAQERIFESFVSEPGGGSQDGIGLGLTIARQLVDLHGGSMTLESQLGRGSTFHVYLPLPNLIGRSAAALAGERPAVLLIAADDRPHDQIAEMCRHQGLSLRRVKSRNDLTAALLEFQPVALAWNLAQAHTMHAAWELFQEIRHQPQLIQLPVLLYYQNAAQLAEPLSGLTGVLLKPIVVSRLLDAIERVRPDTASGPILIVDDDPQTHTLYRRLLIEHVPGYTVRSAYDGREALDLIKQAPPSLLILDLTMPKLDGFAVLEQIRAMPATRHVPVLVISGRVLSNEDIQRLDQARVIFHSKDVLTDSDAVGMIWRALDNRDMLPQHTSTLVKHAVAYLHQNYHRSLTRQEIARAIGVNKDYLSRIFQRELGMTPWDYLNRYRIGRAKELLHNTHTSIAAIAAEVGFADPAYFSRVFHKEAGCSPREYRERLRER